MDKLKSRQPDQFSYLQLQHAKQQKGESEQDFADCCKRMNLRTIRQVRDANTQNFINEEAKRRLLAAFTGGLSGNVGIQVMDRMPKSFGEALNHALIVSARYQNKNKKPFLRRKLNLFGIPHHPIATGMEKLATSHPLPRHLSLKQPF